MVFFGLVVELGGEISKYGFIRAIFMQFERDDQFAVTKCVLETMRHNSSFGISFN